MSPNEIIALDARLTRARTDRAPESPEDEFFETFVAEQILKHFDLTDDELEYGQVGADNDGGLDSVYFLLNGGQLVTDETEINIKTTTRADLFFIQATRTPSFNEGKVENLNLLTEDFLDLSKGEGQLKSNYNSDVLSAMRTFKEKYQLLFACPHDFRISYYYVSKGETKTINAALKKHSDRVQEKAKQLFPSAAVSFKFIGAAELLELTNRQPQKFYPLPYTEIIEPAKQKAWVCLVPIFEYYKFIIDENGQIKNELFEGNVRDWQGDNDVNEAIRQTLESGGVNEDFWWLNNGITILASDASSQGGKVLKVDTPQVVNGLQTSRCIYNYFSTRKEATNERRNILVRIIATQQAESPDHIIKATNSQTQVPPFRLHMTEQIHRNIESLLRNYNLFYDRRKNYYKNDGRPISRIIQPLNLAQTIISTLLQRPNDARARPTSVLDKSYGEIFNVKYPLSMFGVCAVFMRKINSFLLLPDLKITKTDRTNLRWYLAMQYSRVLIQKDSPGPGDLANMKLPDDDHLLRTSYERVKKAYQDLGPTDLTAKGPDLLKAVKKMLYGETE
jgi:hypothetical protein